MIDYRIKTFLAVCQLKSYTAAAEALHISQPAVSGHIRYLENIYNVQLFSLSGKTPTLTKAGDSLRHRAETVLGDEKLFRSSLLNTDNASLSFTLGVTETIGSFAIAKPLSAFLKSQEAFHIDLVVANTTSLLSKMEHGAIDFAILEGSFNSQNVSSITLRTEPFIAVASKAHRFKSPSTTLFDMTKEPLLIREQGSGTRRILEESLSLHGLSPERFASVTTVGSMTALRDMVLYDAGISFFYKVAASPYLERGLLKAIPLEDFSISHPFTGVWPKGSAYSAVYRDLLRKLMK